MIKCDKYVSSGDVLWLVMTYMVTYDDVYGDAVWYSFVFDSIIIYSIIFMYCEGGLAQLSERVLSMHEVVG